MSAAGCAEYVSPNMILRMELLLYAVTYERALSLHCWANVVIEPVGIAKDARNLQ